MTEEQQGNRNQDLKEEELSLEQRKYRDKNLHNASNIKMDKKLGGPNRPSE
jgi:hypothetical protein